MTFGQQVDQKLRDQQAYITELFARYGDVRGPYAIKLNIPVDEVPLFAKKAHLLFNQVLMLQTAFEYRRFLWIRFVGEHEQWYKKTLIPWIREDPQLKVLFALKVLQLDVHQQRTRGWLIDEYGPAALHADLISSLEKLGLNPEDDEYVDMLEVIWKRTPKGGRRVFRRT